MIMINKKGIGPVIASGLLLVVAVVAVVGFQTWFQTYSSSTFVTVEQRSANSVGGTQIESIIGSELYFKNSGTSNITINSVKVNGNDCSVFVNASSGVNTIILGNNCTQNLSNSKSEIVIYTDKGIFNEYFYYTGVVSAGSSSVVVTGPDLTFLGVEVWNITWDHGSGEYGTGIAVDNSNNIFVTGYYWGISVIDILTFKYDSNGVQLWNISYDGGSYDYSTDLAVDTNGDLYMSGYTTNAGYRDWYVVKYNGTDGSPIWNVTYDQGIGDDEAYTIDVDSLNGIVYVGGMVKTANPSVFGWKYAKYNSTTGQLLGGSQSNGVANPSIRGIGVRSDGGFCHATRTDIWANFGYWTQCYNSTGSTLWTKTYNPTTGDELISGLAIDNSDNVYVTGTINPGSEDWFTIKYNSSGSEIWNATYNAGNWNFPYDITTDSFDNVYVTGKSYLGANAWDYYTIKYNGTDGSILWNGSYNVGSEDSAVGIVIDSLDNVYIAGTSFSATTNRDYATVKYD